MHIFAHFERPVMHIVQDWSCTFVLFGRLHVATRHPRSPGGRVGRSVKVEGVDQKVADGGKAIFRHSCTAQRARCGRKQETPPLVVE